jgi:hypothetical protein
LLRSSQWPKEGSARLLFARDYSEKFWKSNLLATNMYFYIIEVSFLSKSMATVTFEDVPDTFVKQYWATVKFTAFQITPKKKSFRERMEDPENARYGPYSGEEFVNIMKTWQWK